MLRTQVQFTEEQHRQLRAFAQERGVSIAEAVRLGVSRLLDDEVSDRKELYARAAALIGSMVDKDGVTDVSDSHDEYLNEAFL